MIQSWQICVCALCCPESCTKNASIPMIRHEHGYLWTFVVSTIVLQNWFFPYALCLIGHEWLCDLAQPLYNWKCKRGGLIKVSCPRVSVVLDHPVAVEIPWMDDPSASFFFFVALVIFLCMVRTLGRYNYLLAEQFFLVCHANLFLLSGMDPILLCWWWSFKLASWKTGNSGFFKLNHCENFVAVITNTYALCTGGNTVLLIFNL
jgi:hypothetical protein